uniref:Uncharacterized protein n=1 Tax=Anguilla anguilla TaxID=7936 RepID=A0A0E9S5Z6_ANGAN
MHFVECSPCSSNAQLSEYVTL